MRTQSQELLKTAVPTMLAGFVVAVIVALTLGAHKARNLPGGSLGAGWAVAYYHQRGRKTYVVGAAMGLIGWAIFCAL